MRTTIHLKPHERQTPIIGEKEVGQTSPAGFPVYLAPNGRLRVLGEGGRYRSLQPGETWEEKPSGPQG